jgi:hypothetical protein
MMEQKQLDSSKFQILIWGDSLHIQQFREETNCEKYPWYVISPYDAIDVVYGKFPTFILTRDGEVVQGVDYRGLDEKLLMEHLK